jgi:hypothetical protein
MAEVNCQLTGDRVRWDRGTLCSSAIASLLIVLVVVVVVVLGTVLVKAFPGGEEG